MKKDKFTASTSYNDLLGCVAADRGDDHNARQWLIKEGRLREDERIAGIEMFISENNGKHKDPINVNFLIIPAESIQKEDTPSESNASTLVRKEFVQMNIHEFFALFKRFHICLSPKGEFDGHHFSFTEQ